MVTFTSSGALATIAVSLDSPSIAIYCVTVLALIFWVALTKTSPYISIDMDPNALYTGVALSPAVDILPIPPVSPRILQLSPIPGNIYKSNHFFYDCMADISQDDFGAVLAFALVHGHPAVVHECPDLQAFQVAHPLAILRPLLEVPLAILAWGWFFLSRGITLAPMTAPPTPAPLAAKHFGDPSGSIKLCCSTCFVQ